jgi:hypothetical protein
MSSRERLGRKAWSIFERKWITEEESQSHERFLKELSLQTMLWPSVFCWYGRTCTKESCHPRAILRGWSLISPNMWGPMGKNYTGFNTRKSYTSIPGHYKFYNCCFLFFLWSGLCAHQSLMYVLTLTIRRAPKAYTFCTDLCPLLHHIFLAS